MTLNINKFTFCDIDSAAERFTSLYGKQDSLNCLGGRKSFSVSVVTIRLDSLILARARARGHSITRGGDGSVHITVPTSGTPFHLRRGVHRYSAVAGESAAIKRWSEPAQVTVDDGMSLSIRVPVKLLTDRAEQLTLGTSSVSPDSQVADLLSVRSATGRVLARTLKTTVEEIEALDSSGLAPLVAAGYQDLLITVVAAGVGRPGDHVTPTVI